MRNHLLQPGEKEKKMSKCAPLGLPAQSSEDTTFPDTYSRAGHLGRQPPPKEFIMTILGRKTEEPYVSRILLDACLRIYNENHAIGKFIIDLTNALDQSSCEIARGRAIYYEQVEFKWWEPEPLGFVAWAVARPRHLIAKFKLLKREFEAILIDCEMEACCRSGGSSPGYEPSASKYFQMLACEPPAREFLVELKAWTAEMRAFIVGEETSKGKKRSVDLSRLRQVCPRR